MYNCLYLYFITEYQLHVVSCIMLYYPKVFDRLLFIILLHKVFMCCYCIREMVYEQNQFIGATKTVNVNKNNKTKSTTHVILLYLCYILLFLKKPWRRASILQLTINVPAFIKVAFTAKQTGCFDSHKVHHHDQSHMSR